MYILGLNCLTDHDSSVALLKDGKVVAAAAEERFTRLKHDSRFPYKAIEHCLAQGNISLNDIQQIGFSWNVSWRTSGLLANWIGRAKCLPYSYNIKEWFFLYNGFRNIQTKTEQTLRNELGYKNIFYRVGHHLSHAAAAFYLSPYEEAAVLTVDGTGEHSTATFCHAQKKKINILGEIVRPASIGLFYGEMTGYLGFAKYRDEYKIMGLASYGSPVYKDKFRKMLRLTENGKFELDLKYFKMYGDFINGFSKYFYNEFGPRRSKGQPISRYYMDIASSLQSVTEDVICHMAGWLATRTGCRNLCLSGGVALNGVANAAILKRKIFDEIFIDPAADDSGTSLGAALYLNNNIFAGERITMSSTFWGPGYADQEILSILNRNKIRFEKHENITSVCAELLAQGKLIGWFQGRMEWGPRALGNRSILADPRKIEMKDIVNISVKYREEFRPFAPAVLHEHAGEYFEMLQEGIPFMNIVVPVKEEKRNTIPAVTHIDGSARVQTVSQEFNPLFREMIGEFYRRTGVPVILNTSFNVKGEPIVCTPDDAIRCFYSTGLDCLIMGKYLIKKEPADVREA